jgi:hypothetical protein
MGNKRGRVKSVTLRTRHVQGGLLVRGGRLSPWPDSKRTFARVLVRADAAEQGGIRSTHAPTGKSPVVLVDRERETARDERLAFRPGGAEFDSRSACLQSHAAHHSARSRGRPCSGFRSAGRRHLLSIAGRSEMGRWAGFHNGPAVCLAHSMSRRAGPKGPGRPGPARNDAAIADGSWPPHGGLGLHRPQFAASPTLVLAQTSDCSFRQCRANAAARAIGVLDTLA